MNLKELVIQKYQNNKDLSKSFIWRLIQVISKQGTSALMFFITTYFLTKEDMGIYGYISATLLLLVIISDFGISTSTSRYIALYNTKSKNKVNKVFFNSLAIIISLSIIVIITILIFKDKLFSQYSQYIPYVLPMVFISPLTSLLDGIYRGLKKFKTLSIISLSNSIVGITISYILVSSYGLVGAILAQVIYFSIYSIILLALYRGYEFKLEKKIITDIGKYAISFGIATLGFYFFSKVNILILAKYNLFEEIAVYELLNKIFMLFLIPFTVFGQVLAPNIVEIYAKENKQKIKKIFLKLLKYLLLSNILFIPVSAILTKIGIGVIFPSYTNGILNNLLLPISLTYAVAVPVTVLNAGILTSTGHAKLMAIQNILSGTINVLVNIWVIQKFGYIGVVWSTFIIQLISTILLYNIWLYKPIEKEK